MFISNVVNDPHYLLSRPTFRLLVFGIDRLVSSSRGKWIRHLYDSLKGLCKGVQQWLKKAEVLNDIVLSMDPHARIFGLAYVAPEISTIKNTFHIFLSQLLHWTEREKITNIRDGTVLFPRKCHPADLLVCLLFFLPPAISPRLDNTGEWERETCHGLLSSVHSAFFAAVFGKSMTAPSYCQRRALSHVSRKSTAPQVTARRESGN